jgi:menaquinone-dependent protoporphyrinogen IX oxidase
MSLDPQHESGSRVLLVYATRHGSTKEVAEAVAEEFRTAGAEVELREASAAPAPDGFDAVVVGAPMIMGWHKDAEKYVKRHREALARVPAAFFVTAASLTEDGKDDVRGVPVVKDPWLVKKPREAGKLRRKERYALPAHYLGDILDACAPARPRTVAFFAGSLDLTTMNIFEKLFVLLIVGATPGDGRNFKAVREWAAGLGDVLLAPATTE